MARKENIEQQVEKIVLELLEGQSEIEMVDVEYVKERDWYLRVFIDKEGGIEIDDCQALSEKLEERLDAEDFITDSYILEVSSPGLGRSLKKDSHFEKSIGEDEELTFYKPMDSSKNAEGTLKAFDEKTVTITVNGEDKTYNRTDLADVRLAIDF